MLGTPAVIFRTILYILIISMMGNVNALVDLVLHPDIPYFGTEHIIVGGIMAFLTGILCVIMEANVRRSDEIKSSQLVVYFWFMAIAWTMIVFSSLAWDIVSEKRASKEIALHEARAIYEKDFNYYKWATEHEGVFVPITEKTKPNQYLRHLP